MVSLKQFWLWKRREEVLFCWNIWTILKSFFCSVWLILPKYKFPIKWSIKNQCLVNYGWFFLASRGLSQGGCQYKYRVCVVGTGFASCCSTGCWSWAGGAIVWELLPKVRVFLASKTSTWQGTLSAVCLPASFYWKGETNATQLNRFWRAGGSRWWGMSFCSNCICLE